MKMSQFSLAFRHFYTLAIVALLTLSGCAKADDDSTASRDALAPKSAVTDALAKPIHTVTVSTVSLEQSMLFYRDTLGLKVTGPIALDDETEATQRALWQIPDDIEWQTYLLRRDGVDGAFQIRLLVLNKPTPSIHKSWSSQELGPFSMGFPNLDQIGFDKFVRQQGFGALNKIEIYEVPRTDGTMYPIHETIFNGPDFVHAVGIYRGDGVAQLGPVDAETGMGGPAYSAQVVADSDAMISFLTDVLGWELRSDRTWKSAGSEGALNAPDGTVFRFSILYSKGATTGHILLVDYKNIEPINPGVAPRLPNLGIGMWTFETTDLDQVLANAKSAGITLAHPAVTFSSPALGKARAATLLAPNGFLIEVFETN